MQLTRIVAVILTSVLVACTETGNEAKNSSDFATSAIEAFYSIEVAEDNKVIYRASFEHEDSSLDLENGDVISIAVGADSLAMEESMSFGYASYSLTRTENQVASKAFFEFTRTSQEDADGSFVKVPDAFVLTSPTSPSANFVPADGKSFGIMWREVTGDVPAPDAAEEFTLRYDFNCRNDSGTPSINSSYVERVDNDGSHVVNLTTILGAGDYDACSQFDIIAIRNNSDGNLDSALKSGSTVGMQVRTLEGALDGLQLL